MLKSYYIALGLLACSCWGDTPQGSTTAVTTSVWDLSLAKLKPPAIAFASLPSAVTYARYVYEIYDCLTVACTMGGGTIPGWKGSDGTSWITMSGGGGSTGPFLVVTFSATQTVDTSTCGVCRVTLTNNMSSFTLSGGTTDRPWTDLELIQDGTGGRTISGLAGNIVGFCTISAVAGVKTIERLSYDGTNYNVFACFSVDPTPENYCPPATGNDTYTCTLTTSLSALTNGVRIVMKADTGNTGTASLNVTGLGGSALGVISILNSVGGALATGDIVANEPALLIYNSTGPAWICQTCLPVTAVTPGSYTATNLTVDAKGRITAAANGSAGSTKLNFGFDFRATSGYAADPAFAVFVTDTTSDATMAYPHTFTNALGVSIVAGWDAGASSVLSTNRFATGAQFQAGMCYITSGTATFRVDLPATGYYQVISVWGDPGYATTNNGLITDNGTTRITVTGTLTNGSTIQSFTDSASKLNSNGFWENTPVGVNFTSTIFRLVLAPGAGDSRIMHLRIVQQ